MFTKIGLDTSAVKEISEQNAQLQTLLKVAEIISVLENIDLGHRKSIGALLTTCFLQSDKPINFWKYRLFTYAFVWLSIAVLFTQITKGQDTAILQGTRRLKKAGVCKSNSEYGITVNNLTIILFF